jgi:hypothetical protein
MCHIYSGNSTASTTLNNHPETLGQKWAGLPQGAKIGVYAGAAGAAGLALAVLLFCCIRQRRVGKREYNVQNDRFMQERTEMMNLQAEWRQKGYIEMRS